MVALASNVIPLEPTGAHPPGYLLGERYRLRSLVGPTSNGALYLASDTKRASTAVGRDVLVRLLDAPWADGAENLLRGSHIAKPSSAITHANVARLLDLGTDAGRAYYVMQWIDHGILLSEHVPPTEGLDLDTFVPIAAQILKAVGHAHSRSTYFGDLDASGVVLGRRKGREHYVVLTSFGLIQDVARDPARHTAYTAPEAADSSSLFSLQRDVYALGVLFWYMLAGEFPPTNTVPSLRASVPRKGVPQPLAELIEECLAPNPDDRPADANAVVERLIDVIPAKLFRLPRIEPGIVGELPGAGNTGLIDLTGIDPSGEYDRAALAQPPAKNREQKRRRKPFALFGLGLAAVATAGVLGFGGWTPWTADQPSASKANAGLVASAAPTANPSPEPQALAPTERLTAATADPPSAVIPSQPAVPSTPVTDGASLDSAQASPVPEPADSRKRARRSRKRNAPAPKAAPQPRAPEAPAPEPVEATPPPEEPEPPAEQPRSTAQKLDDGLREPLLGQTKPTKSEGLMDSVLTRDDGLMKSKDDGRRGSLMSAD